MEPALSLPETLVVLGLDADQGTTRDRLALSYAIAGAQLAELELAGRISVDADQVVAVDAGATGDTDLDELLAKIAGADRPRTPLHWVMKRRSAGLDVYARRLVTSGVVRGESRRLLGFIPRTVFPIVHAGTRERALDAIRAALADPLAPAPRTAALIALLHASEISQRLVSVPEHRARAQRIAVHDVVASAVGRAVAAVKGAAGASAATRKATTG